MQKLFSAWTNDRKLKTKRTQKLHVLRNLRTKHSGTVLGWPFDSMALCDQNFVIKTTRLNVKSHIWFDMSPCKTERQYSRCLNIIWWRLVCLLTREKLQADFTSQRIHIAPNDWVRIDSSGPSISYERAIKAYGSDKYSVRKSRIPRRLIVLIIIFPFFFFILHFHTYFFSSVCLFLRLFEFLFT